MLRHEAVGTDTEQNKSCIQCANVFFASAKQHLSYLDPGSLEVKTTGLRAFKERTAPLSPARSALFCLRRGSWREVHDQRATTLFRLHHRVQF